MQNFDTAVLNLFGKPDDMESEACGQQSVTTTRQVRSRARVGHDGDIVEEQQEVTVKTTIIRWSRDETVPVKSGHLRL
jgi:hypothetical protein